MRTLDELFGHSWFVNGDGKEFEAGMWVVMGTVAMMLSAVIICMTAYTPQDGSLLDTTLRIHGWQIYLGYWIATVIVGEILFFLLTVVNDMSFAETVKAKAMVLCMASTMLAALTLFAVVLLVVWWIMEGLFGWSVNNYVFVGKMAIYSFIVVVAGFSYIKINQVVSRKIRGG